MTAAGALDILALLWARRVRQGGPGAAPDLASLAAPHQGLPRHSGNKAVMIVTPFLHRFTALLQYVATIREKNTN